jgi:hypothetical protein
MCVFLARCFWFNSSTQSSGIYCSSEFRLYCSSELRCIPFFRVQIYNLYERISTQAPQEPPRPPNFWLAIPSRTQRDGGQREGSGREKKTREIMGIRELWWAPPSASERFGVFVSRASAGERRPRSAVRAARMMTTTMAGRDVAAACWQRRLHGVLQAPQHVERLYICI